MGNFLQYINGIEVMRHEGGGVLFAAELPKSILKAGKVSHQADGNDDDGGIHGRLTVVVNNTLTSDTIPQGSYVRFFGRWKPSPFKRLVSMATAYSI